MQHPPPSPHKIDVLIPVYNVESTVTEAVESMLHQSFRDLRVIIVDDGSTDGTPARLAALAAADARIVVHRQPNGGIVAALNSGLALCTGEFVARHDGDDNAFPDRLQKQLDYMNAHPDCIAVAGNAFHIDETGRRTGDITYFRETSNADASSIPAKEPYLMHPLLMVRRQTLVDVGGYRYAFHAEDADLYWRLLSAGRLHNMADFMAEYRIHSNSVSGKSVLNGRIQAVSSQLAALSHRRRLQGLADLSFPAGLLDRFHAAKSLPAIMAVAEEELRRDELPHFRLAVAAKLLELESYRPYKLEPDDRVFTKRTFGQHWRLLSPVDRQVVRKRQAKYIMKELKQGDLRTAGEIMRPALLPAVGVQGFHFVMRRLVRSWKW